MAILDVQTSAPGLSPNFSVATATGDAYPNDGQQFLLMDLPTVRRLIVESPHAGLPNYEQYFGPGFSMSPRFDPLRWNDPSTGRVIFRFNDVDGVSVAVARAGVVGFDASGALVGSLV